MGRKMTCRELIIQTLPREWNNDDTRIVRIGVATVAANPKFSPMIYKDGKWEEIIYHENGFPTFKQERLCLQMNHFKGRLI